MGSAANRQVETTKRAIVSLLNLRIDLPVSYRVQCPPSEDAPRSPPGTGETGGRQPPALRTSSSAALLAPECRRPEGRSVSEQLLRLFDFPSAFRYSQPHEDFHSRLLGRRGSGSSGRRVEIGTTDAVSRGGGLAQTSSGMDLRPLLHRCPGPAGSCVGFQPRQPRRRFRGVATCPTLPGGGTSAPCSPVPVDRQDHVWIFAPGNRRAGAEGPS